MTAKKIRRTGNRQGLSGKKRTMQTMTDLLCSLTVLLIPMVVTAVLSMLQTLAEANGGNVSDGLHICCMLLAILTWLGAAVLTKTRLLGKPMPKTGLTLAGMLLFSVLLYVLAFAMEQEVIGFSPVLWAMGRLFGAPAAVSAGGIQVVLDAEPGTAAMLSCGKYLAVSFIAAFPGKAGKKRE